ncbi:dienelactone hydrolase family protein [Hyphobacterium sp.]|uniref:dienelactone hydrolase family protein n=1 Tax=Hyphobacterium sp. TaxID=2004662 RepID=UPI003B522D8A
MLRRWWIWTGAALLGLVVIYAATIAQNLSGIFVPQRTLDAQIALLRPGVEARLPANALRPIPAVLLFHGCGGQRPMHHSYADAITEAGFAAVLIDSFAPRRIGRFAAMTQVCAGLRLQGQERAADVFAALEIVRSMPEIDSQRLVLAGWSHGGWTLLDAASFAGIGDQPSALVDSPGYLHGVVRIVAIYPYCGFPARASGRLVDGLPPIEIILAGGDMVAPIADCECLARRAEATGADLSYEVWSGVTHAFDDPDAPALDPRMSYDASAAHRLRDRLISTLRESQD